MVHEIPEVQEAIRFGLWRTMPINYEEKRFTAARMIVADSTFFTFFSFPLVSGDPATALKGTHKIVLTQSASEYIVIAFGGSCLAESGMPGKRFVASGTGGSGE